MPTLTEMSYAIGSLIGPILGGELFELTGFGTTSTVFAGVSLLFSFVYLCLVVIPECRGNRKIDMITDE